MKGTEESLSKKIEVPKGLYQLTYLSGPGTTIVHFNYGNSGYDWMLISGSEVYLESSRNENRENTHRATHLRESLHELQNADLPDYIKKILAQIM